MRYTVLRTDAPEWQRFPRLFVYLHHSSQGHVRLDREMLLHRMAPEQLELQLDEAMHGRRGPALGPEQVGMQDGHTDVLAFEEATSSWRTTCGFFHCGACAPSPAHSSTCKVGQMSVEPMVQ